MISFSPFRSYSIVVAVVTLACAASQAGSATATVPRAAGTLATSGTCRVTGAWTLNGDAVSAPAVIRCVLPWYPNAMRAAGEEGEVAFRIAVDSAGVPDSASLRVVRTSAPALVAAVQAAVPYLRFAPAPSRPRVVVEMPFTFTLGR